MNFPIRPMNYFLPNPLKHSKMTFGLLRISSRHCTEKTRTKHSSEVNSRTLLHNTSPTLQAFCTNFHISNKVTHEPHPKYPSKVPFVLSPYLPEKKGLRFNVIFLNNTKVRAFKP